MLRLIFTVSYRIWNVLYNKLNSHQVCNAHIFVLIFFFYFSSWLSDIFNHFICWYKFAHWRPMYGHRLISNRLTGPGVLSFITHEDIQVHVHASNEVPYDIESDIKEDIFYGSDIEIIFKVTDMVNDVSVQDVPISNRKCRFPWERDKHTSPMLYQQYSHSTCAIECVTNIQLELCNCTHHLMPKHSKDANACDVDGLICLTNNFGKSGF